MPSREYDVALSFAGENRVQVDLVAKLLITSKIKVFYDEFEKSNLWGKDLYSHLQLVYRDKAEYCVIFLSADYMKKLWPKHELRQAQERAFSQAREYILPIRLDNTEISGINTTTGYINWDDNSPEKIVELIMEKLKNSPEIRELPESFINEVESAEQVLVGLRSYNEGDKDYFLGIGGYENKVFSLKKVVTSQSSFVTFLCGDVGIGKTSLLQAGLIPSLKAEKKFEWECMFTRPHSDQNITFDLENLKILFPDISSSVDFQESLNILFKRYEDNSVSKILIVIDQFEDYSLTEKGRNYLTSLFDMLYQKRDGKYRSRLSIVVSCRNNSQDHIDFISKLLKDRKNFTTFNLDCIDIKSAELYLKAALSIVPDEAKLFDEFFHVLKELSNQDKYLKNSKLIYPPYLQIFGECWNQLSNRSRMTHDIFSTLKIDGKISVELIMNSCLESIQALGHQRKNELYMLHDLISTKNKEDNLDLTNLLYSLKNIVNQLNQNHLNEAVKRWGQNLCGGIASWSTTLSHAVNEQINDGSVDKVIEDTLDWGCIIPNLVTLLNADQSKIQMFIKNRGKRYEAVNVILILSLYFNSKDKMHGYKNYFRNSLNPSHISGFNKFLRDNL